MKNLFKLFLTIACVCSSLLVSAQFTVGIKGGINYSAIKIMNNQAIQDGKLNNEGILGYNIGAFARIGNVIYVQPEAYIGSQGSKFVYKPNDGQTAEDVQSKFTVLNVPVLIGTSIGVSGLNLRVNAGPVATILLDKNITFGKQFAAAYDDFKDYKNTTIGLQAGVGVDVAKFTFDARYELGLQKMNEKYGQRQNLFTFSVGIKIL